MNRLLEFKGLTYGKFLNYFDLNYLAPFPICLTPEQRTPSNRKTIYLRHDIDSNINASVQMAEFEAAMGIKSHYYALHLSDYWDKEGFKKLRYIQSLGHEIGFHNAILTELILNWKLEPGFYLNDLFKEEIIEKIDTYITTLREEDLLIRGTCAHGHPTCNTHNYGNIQIWNQAQKPYNDFSVDLRSFNLEYDCNVVFRHDYLSDSGNEWHGYPLTMVQKVEAGHNLMINIHPQWWLK